MCHFDCAQSRACHNHLEVFQHSENVIKGCSAFTIQHLEQVHTETPADEWGLPCAPVAALLQLGQARNQNSYMQQTVRQAQLRNMR
jgi:hypothetical protein